MPRLAVLLAALAAAQPVAAQTPDERLPRVVADLHGATVGLPTADGWVVALPTDTPRPGRAWGMSAAGHVFVGRLGFATLGVGASFTTGEATSDPLVTSEGKPTTGTATTRMTNLAPQFSVNFGRRLGWSYLSAGYGVSKIGSSFVPLTGTSPTASPEGWNPALNFGGGARWFMKPHLGAGFDVRFTKLGSRETTAERAGAKRTRVFSISVGISLQ